MSTALTKKQQKALAFRSKQKAKRSGKEEVVPQDVPEEDPIDDDAPDQVEEPVIAESSKKRKREDEASEAKAGTGAKAKGKGKAKNAWDDEAEGEGEEGKPGKKSKKEIKQRFILFVGNLGYKTTREDVQAHFAEAAGQKPDVRLLTTKPEPKSKVPPKSRGIAFLEVASSEAMQACLKLHHSEIQNRRINVELTAGGGGKSDTRQGKIKERNDRVGGQRERRAEKEKEAEAEAARANGGVIPVVETDKRPRNNRDRGGDKEQKREVEVVREDGPMTATDGSTVKVRGGRRSKVNPTDTQPSRGYAGAGGHPSGQQRGGYQNRSNGPPGRGGFQGGAGGLGGFGRPKFELTGANAIGVQRS